jgi:hypothetical protein
MLALGALGCEAAFSLLAVPHLTRLGPLAVSTYACLFAVPMLAFWSLVAEGPTLPLPDAGQAAALAYLALGVAEITPGRLGAVVVVALGVTLGVRGGAMPLGQAPGPRLRSFASGG